MQNYATALCAMPGLEHVAASNIVRLRDSHLAQRNASRLRVGVCGWCYSHNAAGRAYTLAMLYERFAEVELIGSLYVPFGRDVWEPIRHTPISKHLILADGWARFLDDAIELVAGHPYDVVHLVKPRAPNILMGLLYRLMWGSRVLMDIDDEELGFVGDAEAVELDSYLSQHGALPNPHDLVGTDWTRIAVGLANEFDGVTVSNVALRTRYGGVVVSHARDESLYHPSPRLTESSRAELGVPAGRKVVLFFGTPRVHKGLTDIAKAIAQLGRDDVVFVVVGDFPDLALKFQLLAIQGVHYHFIGNVPFTSVPGVVAIADVCVLLQDSAGLAARYQVPAKLSDALAMGIPVIASMTPALADAFEAGALLPADRGSLPLALRQVLDDDGVRSALCSQGRRYFERVLTLQGNSGVLQAVARGSPATRMSPALLALLDAFPDARLSALAVQSARRSGPMQGRPR